MAGQGRTRADARPKPSPESSPPPRRVATRRTPAAEEAVAMPPPPARAGRGLRAQSKDAEPKKLTAARRGAPVPTSGYESAASLPSYVTQENDDASEDEEATEVAVTESVGASSQRDQRERQHSVVSVVAGSEIYQNTPGGSRAQARVLKIFLPRLFDAADDLQAHLYSSADDGAWLAEYKAYVGAFDHFRRHYSIDTFINEADVMEKIGAMIGTPLAYSTSRSISAANIASFLDDINRFRTSPLQPNEVLAALQSWDDAFPTKFVPRREPNQPRWMDESNDFTLAVELRTQTMIYTLECYPDQDELLLTHNVWCIRGEPSPRPELLAFLEGQDDGTVTLKDLAGLDMNQEQNRHYRDQYTARIQVVWSLLASGNRASVLAGLKKNFAIEPLMHRLRQWGHLLFKQVQAAMDARDHTPVFRGYEATPSQLASQVGDSQVGLSQAESESQVDPLIFSQPLVRASPGPNDAAPNAAAMEALRQLEAAAAQSQDDSQPPSIADYDILARRHTLVPQSSNYPPPPDLGYSSLPLAPPREGVAFAQSAAQASGSVPGPSTAASGVALGKRPRDTQDDDFEVDGRQADSQRQAGAVKAPRRKRARKEKQVVTADIEASQTPRRPPPAAALEPDLEALSQRSREIALANRKPKEPQSRQPWSRHDSKQLIKAVDVYKCKWSTIEEEIKRGTIVFERPRNQQSLRDKARLLKQDFLKTDAPLPPSFDLVVLGKKEKEAIKACGKNPDRKEADLDDNDKPINTVYVEGPEEEAG